MKLADPLCTGLGSMNGKMDAAELIRAIELGHVGAGHSEGFETAGKSDDDCPFYRFRRPTHPTE
jgi:hypothetical protein